MACDPAGARSKRVCRVAVIGAGAAGLVAARELIHEGHHVMVFEQQSQLGGIWLYTDEVDSDLYGQQPCRRRVHSSMYQGLTTNLPREIMGFSDFPLAAANMAGRSMDSRRYPCSEEVLRYLQAFAAHYKLQPVVCYNAQVLQAQPSSANGAQQRWTVKWQQTLGSSGGGGGAGHKPTQPASAGGHDARAATPAGIGSAVSLQHTDEFDAVLVCNGHYSEPHLPELPGAQGFPGLLLHSHNYRRAEQFAGQCVAVVGASFSGLDAARLVAQKASCVYVCAREWKSQTDLDRASTCAAFAGQSNMHRRGMITQLTKAGGARFAVGAAVGRLDAVICCTGYEYYFPFLDLKELGLSTADQHVDPLYQHMFAPGYGAGLAFIGLPWRVVPFPMFELQAKLCARLLSGRTALPPAADMTAWLEQHKQQLATEGLPPSYSHYMDHKQLAYHAWLASMCGPDVLRIPNWRAVLLHAYWTWRWCRVTWLAHFCSRKRQQQQQQQENANATAVSSRVKVTAVVAAATAAAAAFGVALQRLR